MQAGQHRRVRRQRQRYLRGGVAENECARRRLQQRIDIRRQLPGRSVRADAIGAESVDRDQKNRTAMAVLHEIAGSIATTVTRERQDEAGNREGRAAEAARYMWRQTLHAVRIACNRGPAQIRFLTKRNPCALSSCLS